MPSPTWQEGSPCKNAVVNLPLALLKNQRRFCHQPQRQALEIADARPRGISSSTGARPAVNERFIAHMLDAIDRAAAARPGHNGMPSVAAGVCAVQQSARAR